MDAKAFEKIISEEQFAKPFIEALTGYEIAEITVVDAAAENLPAVLANGVFFDAVLADGAHTKCHIAIQAAEPYSCEQYIRHVQSAIDCRSMELAEMDEEDFLLRRSCAILVCPRDPYKQGLAVYTRKDSYGGVEVDSGAQAFVLNADFRIENAKPLVCDFLRRIKNEFERDVTIHDVVLECLEDCKRAKRISERASEPTNYPRPMLTDADA